MKLKELERKVEERRTEGAELANRLCTIQKKDPNVKRENTKSQYTAYTLVSEYKQLEIKQELENQTYVPGRSTYIRDSHQLYFHKSLSIKWKDNQVLNAYRFETGNPHWITKTPFKSNEIQRYTPKKDWLIACEEYIHNVNEDLERRKEEEKAKIERKKKQNKEDQNSQRISRRTYIKDLKENFGIK